MQGPIKQLRLVSAALLRSGLRQAVDTWPSRRCLSPDYTVECPQAIGRPVALWYVFGFTARTSLANRIPNVVKERWFTRTTESIPDWPLSNG